MSKISGASDLCQCSGCGQMKVKRFLRWVQRPVQKKAIYVDDTGRQWNNRRCPSCHQIQTRKAMARKGAGRRARQRMRGVSVAMILDDDVDEFLIL